MPSEFPIYSLNPNDTEFPVIKIKPISLPSINYNVIWLRTGVDKLDKTVPFIPNKGTVKFYMHSGFYEGLSKLIPVGGIYEYDAENMPTLYPPSSYFSNLIFEFSLGFLWYDPTVKWRDNIVDDRYYEFWRYFSIGGGNILYTVDLGQVYTLVKVSSKMQHYLPYSGYLTIEASLDGSTWSVLYYATDYMEEYRKWSPVKMACWNGEKNARYLAIRENLSASVSGDRGVRIYEWNWYVI